MLCNALLDAELHCLEWAKQCKPNWLLSTLEASRGPGRLYPEKCLKERRSSFAAKVLSNVIGSLYHFLLASCCLLILLPLLPPSPHSSSFSSSFSCSSMYAYTFFSSPFPFLPPSPQLLSSFPFPDMSPFFDPESSVLRLDEWK